MRADLGPLTDQRHIAIGNRIALAAGKFSGVAQEDVAFRAFPLRVRRREMTADIAHRQGTIDRIGQRMHAHIGVGMAQKPFAMRHLDPTKPDMIAFAKGMYVKAVSKPQVHAAPFHDCRRAIKITGEGQFQIVLFALDDGDGKPRSAGHFHIVCRAAGMGAVGGQNRIKVKALWGLRAVKPSAVTGAADQSLRASPQCVGYRKGRGRSGREGERPAHPVDHRC